MECKTNDWNRQGMSVTVELKRTFCKRIEKEKIEKELLVFVRVKGKHIGAKAIMYPIGDNYNF